MLNVILQSPTFKHYKYSNNPDLRKDAEVSRSAAEEGMVLLKNEKNTLPLKKSVKLAVFGNTSYSLIAGGTGSGDVNKAYTVSLAQGLPKAGFVVNNDLQKAYTDYLAGEKAKHPKKSFMEEFMNPTPPAPEWIPGNDLLSKLAGESDAAILTIGRNSGEGRDRKLENDYYLSDSEKVIIKNISDAFHAQNKKVVIVLNIGGVIEVASWRDQVDAILLAWQPGLEGGSAIANILGGQTNPSGKLATTFPVDYKDVASAKNFPAKNFRTRQQPAILVSVTRQPRSHMRDIYVGYRYFNTFHVSPPMNLDTASHTQSFLTIISS